MLAEDGAIFVGEITATNGKFRASCHAEHDYLSHLETEEQQIRMWDTYEQAKAWINDVAALRGFKSWQNRSAK